MATPSRSHLTPSLDTAPRIPTGIRRLDRSILCSFCTTGSTKTLAPITTFWPDMSVLTWPAALVVDRPLAPVTRNAWLGPATLMRLRISRTTRTTRTALPMMAMRTGLMSCSLALLRWCSGDSDNGAGGNAAGGSKAVETTSTEVSVGTSTTYTGVPTGNGC